MTSNSRVNRQNFMKNIESSYVRSGRCIPTVGSNFMKNIEREGQGCYQEGLGLVLKNFMKNIESNLDLSLVSLTLVL